jgi:hypothetical protein
MILFPGDFRGEPYQIQSIQTSKKIGSHKRALTNNSNSLSGLHIVYNLRIGSDHIRPEAYLANVAAPC